MTSTQAPAGQCNLAGRRRSLCLSSAEQKAHHRFLGASLSLRQGTAESFTCRKKIGGASPSAIISIARTAISRTAIRRRIFFSFNSPLGACETCRGFGRIIDIDLDLVIPDPGKVPQRRRHQAVDQPQPGACAACSILRAQKNPDQEALGRTQRQTKAAGHRRRRRLQGHPRLVSPLEAAKAIACMCACCWRATAPICSARIVKARRLKPDALHYRIDGKDIAQVNAMNVGAAHDFFHALETGRRARSSVAV